MSCTAVQTYYAGDGTQKTFTFNFEYINESDVKVGIYDATTELYVDKAQDDATYGWSFANATTIEFVTAPPADPDAPGGNNIRIYRDTDIDSLEATFYPGSSIRAQDLNDNFEQLRMSLEEGQCYFSGGQQAELDDRYWSKIEAYTSVDQLAQNPVSDDTIITSQAAADRHDTILSQVTSTPVQPGKLWANTNNNTFQWWDAPNSTWVNSGQAGPKGDKGDKGDPGDPGGAGAQYKGQTDFTAPEPADPENGDFWINTVEGQAAGAWTGFVGEDVLVNDRAIYNGNTNQWDLISDLTGSQWEQITNVITPINSDVDTVREEKFAVGVAGLSSTIQVAPLTVSRTATLPDKSGTIAFLDDIAGAGVWTRDDTNDRVVPDTDTDDVYTKGSIVATDDFAHEKAALDPTGKLILNSQGEQTVASGSEMKFEVGGDEKLNISPTTFAVRGTGLIALTVGNTANISAQGTFRGPTNTIPNGSGVELRKGNNLYYNGTHTIDNPLYKEVGQSGLIFFQTEATSFGSEWKLTDTAYPAYSIAPYYVRTSSQVVVGKATDWTP